MKKKELEKTLTATLAKLAANDHGSGKLKKCSKCNKWYSQNNHIDYCHRKNKLNMDGWVELSVEEWFKKIGLRY